MPLPSRTAAVSQQRTDNPGDRKFTSELAKDYYLSPHPVGCAKHRDPDCLCDVQIASPVAATHTPTFLVGVETPEQLLEAATDMWLRLDVLERHETDRGRDVNDGRGGYHSPVDQMTHAQALDCAMAVRSGASFEKIKSEFPISHGQYMMIRDMANAKRSRAFIPEDRVVEMLDSGMTLVQVRDLLHSEGVPVKDISSLSRVYKRKTGQTLSAKHRTQRKADMAARLELAQEVLASGVTGHGDIAAVMTARGLPTSRSSVSKYFREGRLVAA